MPWLVAVVPPICVSFSSSTTLAPLSLASTAAATPAPPAPTTTTSVVISIVSPSACSAFGAAVLSASMSAPASVSACSAAARMALLVTVAPVTVSTARLWAATIAAGIFSIAGSQIPAVSACSTTSTAVIAPPSTVTATFTAPPMP